MEDRKFLNIFCLKRVLSTNPENHQGFLLAFIGLSIALHSYFLANSNSLQNADIVHYSESSAQQVSIKVNLYQPPKTIVQKVSKSKSALKKVSNLPKSAAPAINKMGENKAVKQNQGSRTKLAEYVSRIRQLINEKKEYPVIAKRLKHQGRFRIELWINEQGKIVSKKYLEKPSSGVLFKATEKIFQTISSFGKIPSEITERPLKIVVPIAYQLL